MFCGNGFSKKSNESSKNWINKRKYCSRYCKDKSIIGKKSNSKTKFFKGQIPWNKGLKGYRAGELNNKWKGGITSENDKIRKSDEYKNWRKSVYLRDNFICQGCKKVGGRIHAHHINPFSKFPKLRFDINNGITLCFNCHKAIHYNLNFN